MFPVLTVESVNPALSEFAVIEIPSLMSEGLLPVFLFIRTPFSLQFGGFVQLMLADAGEDVLLTVSPVGFSGAESVQASEMEVDVAVCTEEELPDGETRPIIF